MSGFHKAKISLDQITYGPKTETVDEVTAFTYAGELYNRGYRRTSNAYCHVSRIDREDWLDVLAEKLRCARADFYNRDGSGIADTWRDHYIRCHSKDTLTVHPSILRRIPGY